MDVLVIILLILFSIIAWRSPRHGVFVILATLPVYQLRFNLGPIPTTALEAMIWILFIISILPLWKRGISTILPLRIRGSERGLVVPRRFLIPAALLFLAATVSVFVAPDTRAALGVWKAYFVDPLIFVFVLLTSLRGANESERRSNPGSASGLLRSARNDGIIITALALCAAIVSLAVIIQWLTRIGIPPPWNVEGRATGLFPYPNANGLLLAPIATFVIARSVATKQSSERWLYAVVGIFSLLAMALTKSEAGLLAAAAGIFLSIFFPLPRRGKIKMGVLVAVILATLLLIPTTRDKLLLRDWSGIVRRHTWSETFDMLRDRPILGAGLSGFPIAFAPYHITRDAIEIFQYPHNIFLNFWSETGLLGLIAFAWISFFVIARSERSERRSNPERDTRLLHSVRNDSVELAAKLALLTLLIHGLVDVPYFKNDLAVLSWTLVTFIVMSPQQYERQQFK